MYIIVATLMAIMLVMPIQTRKLPSEFEKCTKNDPNVDKCIARAIEKAVVATKDGIPSYHLQPSDPLSIPKFVVEDQTNGAVNLNLVGTDVKVHGLKDIKITNVKSDLNKREVQADVFIKSLSIDADYDMNGKFLVLPLSGKGKFSAQIDDVKAKLNLKADPKTKNGEIYWDIKNFDLDVYDIKKLTTKFDNLFNGDEALAKPTQQSLNENWKDLWVILKQTIEEFVRTILKNTASKIFDEVPEKEFLS